MYDSQLSEITCNFNLTDTSIKSCTVMYGQCDQEPDKNVTGTSTVESPNLVVLQLGGGTQLECYTVTASSDTFTIIVESRNENMGKCVH